MTVFALLSVPFLLSPTTLGLVVSLALTPPPMMGLATLASLLGAGV